MILSASRRTDIPRYFSEWFLKRIEDGFVYVRNPMNIHQVSKIEINANVVDCIVFWTKNPKPMLDKLNKLEGYNYYFQFSLTGYGVDLETAVPHKKNEMIPIFKDLSKKIGKNRVIWRYDPIIFTDKYDERYHLKAFQEIAESLNGYCDRVVISFVDYYKKTERNMKEVSLEKRSDAEKLKFLEQLSKIAKSNNLKIETCAELCDLEKIGINHSKCIDEELIEEIIGYTIKAKKDSGQRKECGCVESIDIGAYNTCSNGCKYCYANFNSDLVSKNLKLFNVNSPLLCSEINEKDLITTRKVKTFRDDVLEFEQLTLF